jgi:hypothetical protein
MLSPRLLSFSGEVIPSSAMIRTYFNPSAVDTLLSDQREGRADNSFKVWNLLNLALWHQHWFE